MVGKKLTVVISQAQGKNPVKRQLEEEIAAALMMRGDVEVSLVPHLYDMHADHTGYLFLRSVPGHFVLLSWLYSRGTHWILDRQGIKGHEGLTLLKEEEEGDSEEVSSNESDPPVNPDIVSSRHIPNRHIYSIDMRVSANHQDYLEEIDRIVAENSVQTFDLMSFGNGSVTNGQPQNGTLPEKAQGGKAQEENKIVAIDPTETVKRRWYPVIDYSRCTNCMECIDFCLFGVYGIDQLDTILVEEQESCKKGCPACSRVCPENAIIFPGHKTPAIAGAEGDVAGLKIDLSKLFGGGESDNFETAILERDRELAADGRETVGATVGIPKRQTNKQSTENDELDDLMDELDAMEL